MKVSACLVTRGDVDISTIVNSLPFDDVVIWNNAEREEDLACYGRFAAIAEAKHDIIYVQDDDLMVPIPALLKAWDNDKGVLANNRLEQEWRYLGCGALFHRDLVNFDTYLERHGDDMELFYRVADIAFAYQHPYRRVWLGYCDFPWQTADNRMYKQDHHFFERRKARADTLALTEDTT